MEKLELCGVEVYALLNVLGDVLAERDERVLQDVYDCLCGRSASGKVVTVSLSAKVDFSGDVLGEYLEQLDDYEDTRSQREWFVLDRLFGGMAEQVVRMTDLVVTEE